MKKALLILIVSGICFSGYAQQQQKHEKRTYTAPNGKFYINKDLPVYLRLSTSPDAGAESKLLESAVTKQYTNPFYFDAEGMNTLRTPSAVDPKTKKLVYPVRDVVFEVYADGLPPVTKSTFTGAPRYSTGGTVYYGKGLVVTLKTTDAVSGVEKTYFSRDGAAYQAYASPVNMTKEGSNNFKYYAADFVGNAENPNTREYVVDLSTPKTTYAVSDPKKGNIISPKARFTLSGSDNLAGVRITQYKFDNGSLRSYGRAISPAYLSDGDHTFTYYSTDNVKNAETANTYQFYLDKIPPVPVYTIVGDQHKGNYVYVSPRTTIKLDATDNKAGVENIQYLIDGRGNTVYSTNFNIPNVKGLHRVSYYSIDQVTNRSSNKYFTVYMDNVSPTTAIIYGSPQFFDRDTLWVNSTTNVTLRSRDAESGVQKTEYTVRGGSFKTYSSPFTIAGQGLAKLTFKATDNVNNVETVKSSEVFVDNTPPVIYINFSIASIGTKSKDGKTIPVYPNYTRLYVGATDAHCGTHRIMYSINGSEFRDYSSPYTLDVSELNKFQEKKFYTVVIKAKDKLGNESQKTVDFYVGNE